MKRTLFGLVVLLVSVAAHNAKAEPAATTDPAPQGSMAPPSKEVVGVVTNVDQSKKRMTVVAPIAFTEELAKVGGTVVVDKERSLVAISGAFSKDATIMRDGKVAQMADIKEGDIVRATFNHETESFGPLRVTSKDAIKKQADLLRKDVKETGKKATP